MQVDGTLDVSAKERVSLIASLDCEVVKRQLRFVDVSKNRDAAALSQIFKEIHSRIKEKPIMQTYDGAAVMSDQISCVQAQVCKEYLFAYFVHCAAHRLNLVLCQSASSMPSVTVPFLAMP